MNRTGKEAIIEEVGSLIKRSGAAFVADYRGLKVEDLTGLRKSLREVSATFKVVKNTLARLAFKGSEMENLAESFDGPTALIFSHDDPVATVKVVTDFSKERENLKIKTGMLGDRLLTKEDVKALSTLPDLGTVRGRIVGLLQAPAVNLARLVAAPGTQLARVVGAYSDKG